MIPRESKKKKQTAANALQRVVKKNITGEHATQLCLEQVKILDLIEIIPDDFDIKSLSWKAELNGTIKKLAVPDALKSCVGYVRESRLRVQAEGVFRELNKAQIKKLVPLIAEEYGLTKDAFKAHILTIKKGNATCVFQYSKKEIRDVKDRRCKIAVLGLIAISRDPVLKSQANDMIARLSLKKYQCRTHIVEKKIVLCAKLS